MVTAGYPALSARSNHMDVRLYSNCNIIVLFFGVNLQPAGNFHFSQSHHHHHIIFDFGRSVIVVVLLPLLQVLEYGFFAVIILQAFEEIVQL